MLHLQERRDVSTYYQISHNHGIQNKKICYNVLMLIIFRIGICGNSYNDVLGILNISWIRSKFQFVQAYARPFSWFMLFVDFFLKTCILVVTVYWNGGVSMEVFQFSSGIIDFLLALSDLGWLRYIWDWQNVGECSCFVPKNCGFVVSGLDHLTDIGLVEKPNQSNLGAF